MNRYHTTYFVLLLTQISLAQTFHRDEVGRITAEEYEDFAINYEYNTGGGLLRKWISPEVGGSPFPVLGDTLTQSICEGDSVLFHNNYYKTASIYQDTIIGSLDVDTVYWLNLTTLQTYDANISESVCSFFIFGNDTLRESDVYSKSFQSTIGCDSLVTLDLTILELAELEPDTVEICAESYTWYEKEYTSSGDYTFEVENNEGCKSIATLHLNLNLVIGEITTIDTCASQINYHGELLNESRFHEITIQSSGGCDSLARFNLNLNQNERITLERNEKGLIAPNRPEFSYTWRECHTERPVSGETNFSFSPKIDGEYFVEISDGVCTYYSQCYGADAVLTVETEPSKALYPNPTNGNITLSLTNAQQVKRVEAVDVSGKAIPIEFEILSNNELELQTQELARGVYLIKVNQGTGSYKLIKED